MDSLTLNRVLKQANYIIKYEDTVRDISKIFNVSKSTVNNDLHERLKYINETLYLKVKNILDYHTKIRHLRGGESTKKKYIKKSNNMV